MGSRFYSFLWTVMRPVYGLFYPRRVSGLENIPAEGGFILCANHFSNHDPLYVSSCIPKSRQMRFLAKKELFPQGTRSPDNSPTPMLNGASLIALRGGVPVIPAYVDGPYRLFRKTAVRFGPPIDLSAFGRRCDSETLSNVTHAIEGAVWGLRDGQETAL